MQCVWLTLAHSHENRVGRSANCKSCQVFGNAKSRCDTNLWESIHHVRAQLLHTASPLIQHVGPGRQNFEVEQRVFLWRRWANPWLQPNTGDLAQTEKMWHHMALTKIQKMLKSERSNPPALTSFHPGHLQLLHQGMAGCRLTYQCRIAPRARGAYRSALHKWVITGHEPIQMPPNFDLMAMNILFLYNDPGIDKTRHWTGTAPTHI